MVKNRLLRTTALVKQAIVCLLLLGKAIRHNLDAFLPLFKELFKLDYCKENLSEKIYFSMLY